MNDKTRSRPYAKAIFELAREQHQLNEIDLMLKAAKEMVQSSVAKTLMQDPLMSAEQLLDYWKSWGEDIFSPLMENFLKTLIQAKRLKLLPLIASLFEELRQQEEEVVPVEVISAYPLTKKEQEHFTQVLKKRLQSEIHLTYHTDKQLIGGAILRSRDVVIDGSVKGRLRKMQEALGVSN